MNICTYFTRFIAGIFAGPNIRENNGLAKRGGRPGFNAIERQYSRSAIAALLAAVRKPSTPKPRTVIEAGLGLPGQSMYRRLERRLQSGSDNSDEQDDKHNLLEDKKPKKTMVFKPPIFVEYQVADDKDSTPAAQ
jgi:ATP-dependent DNA ligase